MKLLLDENLSRRIVPFLQALYPGSSQVALEGLDQDDDAEICRYAEDTGSSDALQIGSRLFHLRWIGLGCKRDGQQTVCEFRSLGRLLLLTILGRSRAGGIDDFESLWTGAESGLRVISFSEVGRELLERFGNPEKLPLGLSPDGIRV